MDDKKRLFFALVPPDNIKQEILGLVSKLKLDLKSFTEDHSALVALDNYHITLLYLGDVHIDLTAQIISCASKINCKCFDLKITKTGYFKRSKVLWFGPKNTPDELEYLIDGLKINLADVKELMIKKSVRLGPSSYNPHITLIKKIRDISSHPGLLKNKVNIPWAVDRFYLLESVFSKHEVKYEIIAEFVFD